MRLNRLLLIEDEADHAALVRAYCQILPGGAIAVDSRETKAGGVEALEQERYAVVLLDLHLPDSSGIELVDAIVLAAQDVPVLVLTTLDDRSLALAAIARGAQDYLLKTRLTPDALDRALRNAVQRKAFERELARYEAPLAAEGGKLLRLTRDLVRALGAPLAVLRGHLGEGVRTGALSGVALAEVRAAERQVAEGLDQLEELVTGTGAPAPQLAALQLDVLLTELVGQLGTEHRLVLPGPLPRVRADERDLRRLLSHIAGTLLQSTGTAERSLCVRLEPRREPGPVLVFECVGPRGAPTGQELELVVALAQSSADLLGGGLWQESGALVIHLPGMGFQSDV